MEFNFIDIQDLMEICRCGYKNRLVPGSKLVSAGLVRSDDRGIWHLTELGIKIGRVLRGAAGKVKERIEHYKAPAPADDPLRNCIAALSEAIDNSPDGHQPNEGARARFAADYLQMFDGPRPTEAQYFKMANYLRCLHRLNIAQIMLARVELECHKDYGKIPPLPGTTPDLDTELIFSFGGRHDEEEIRVQTLQSRRVCEGDSRIRYRANFTPPTFSLEDQGEPTTD